MEPVLCPSLQMLQVKNNSDNLKKIGKFLYLPFQMLVIVGMFGFVGYKLDKWLATSFPIFLLIFIILGIALSLYNVFLELKK